MFEQTPTPDRRDGRMGHGHGHGHEHGGRFARDEFGGPGFGGPGFGGPGRGHRRPGGGRMRRGEIRTAVLAILLDGPGHGYDLIQRLEEKSGGWRPSPGSMYPTLQLLEDEDLIRSSERDGKKVFELTDAGRAEAERRVEEAGGAPWEQARGAGPNRELREAVGQAFLAAKQVASIGSPEQVERALGILRDTRKQLYQLLGED